MRICKRYEIKKAHTIVKATEPICGAEYKMRFENAQPTLLKGNTQISTTKTKIILHLR